MNSKSILTFILFSFFVSIQSQNLTLMTYNMRLDTAIDGDQDWTHRKDFFVGQINFYEPDIFGVQEATPGQVTDLNSLLKDYDQIGMGREGIGKGESSNIYYKKDRFKVLQERTFWLSETPDTISIGWDAACNRVCTYALFKDLKTKTKFWVFNTHLDHVGEIARTKGIELILSKIKELNTQNLSVFFMGDFNSEPSSQRIVDLKKIMTDTQDIAVKGHFGPSGTFNGFKHEMPVTTLIDYIFISKESSIQVIKHATLSDSIDLKYPSDHLPVYIEVLISQ
ncbi:MAG: endonuclease/exonuclease/phosphatase family protein [Flavobacteriaceae bacterium]|nr:endonuclease/exonuclease/phosphatase family protein [Flavobacteriaceae bacterium]